MYQIDFHNEAGQLEFQVLHVTDHAPKRSPVRIVPLWIESIVVWSTCGCSGAGGAISSEESEDQPSGEITIRGSYHYTDFKIQNPVSKVMGSFWDWILESFCSILASLACITGLLDGNRNVRMLVLSALWLLER